ncbi:MAG: hypothetical protein HYV63_00630 [Candidatus Schekmanbacteria bacterium]|nr:hypothetical protein [Candidatus Schekmanbacteria bacterium]
MGLHVVGASHVLNYTRRWHLAPQEQATSRAHRIGQALPVYVYQLVVGDNRFKTAEVRLAELLESKRRLAGDSLRPASALQVTEAELRDCPGCGGERVAGEWRPGPAILTADKTSEAILAANSPQFAPFPAILRADSRI